MGHVSLITGGARSGKSQFAEQLIADNCSTVAYIATAKAFDAEMEDRIKKHRQQRPSSWRTFEESYHPSAVITANSGGFDGFLLDCLTVLTTNLILRDTGVDWDTPAVDRMNRIEEQVVEEVDALLQAAESYNGRLIAVTNEVGLGIVPDTPLSRFFRDCSGRVNQRMAARADEVYLVVSGIPMSLKGGAGAP